MSETARVGLLDQAFPRHTFRENSIDYRIVGRPDRAFIELVHGKEWLALPAISLPLNSRIIGGRHGKVPGVLHIPKASPSAHERNTRRNGYSNDLNRQFHKGLTDPEAVALRMFFSEIRKKYGKLKRVLITHSDLFLKSFYMYDVGNANDGLDHNAMLREIEEIGIPLYSGVDDANDPTLGYHVVRGYVHIPRSKFKDGSLETYLVRNSYADRVIVAEIPGRGPDPIGDALVVGKVLEKYMMES